MLKKERCEEVFEQCYKENGHGLSKWNYFEKRESERDMAQVLGMGVKELRKENGYQYWEECVLDEQQFREGGW